MGNLGKQIALVYLRALLRWQVLAPVYLRISSMHRTSSIRGQCLKITVPRWSRAAAIIGRTAFLDPWIRTRPSSLCPPSIRYCPTAVSPFKNASGNPAFSYYHMLLAAV